MNEDKVALVTGAAYAIGRAIAKRLVASGCRVCGVDVKGEELENVAGQVRESGGEFLAETFDLYDIEKIPALVERVIERFGRVDILVNNAYYAAPQRFLDITFDDEWERQIRVNLAAAIALSQGCARDMARRKWGRIINISSVAALRGAGGEAGYIMVKGALNSLTKAMALQLAPMGICVNAVSPACIESLPRQGGPAYRKHAAARLPRGRVGQPEDVAAMVAFLASDDADYCMGGNYLVDGGYCLP